MRVRRSGLDRFGPALLFASVTVCLFWRCFLLGEVPVAADVMAARYTPWKERLGSAEVHNPLLQDTAIQLYPYRTYAGRALRQGRIPLWNPLVSCGQPFLANGQSAVFSIPNVLCWLPDRLFFSLAVILQIPLAFLAMWLLLEEMGCGRFGKTLGALGFGLGGYVAVWCEWGTIGYAALCLPGALFSLARGKRLESTGWYLAGGAILGASFLQGHLQVSLYGLLGVLVVAIAQAVRTPGWRHHLLRIGAALCLALALSAPQTLPTLELSRASTRQDVARYGELNPMPPPYLLGYVCPYLFGSPVRGDFVVMGRADPRGGANFSEYTSYLGILPLLAALAALTSRRRGSGGYAALALLSLLWATGTAAYAPLFHLGGPFKRLYVCRALMLAAFGLSVLAGMGVEALVRVHERTAPSTNGKKWWRRVTRDPVLATVALVTVGFTLLVLALRAVHQFSPQAGGTLGYLLRVRNPAVLLPLAFLWVALLMVVAVQRGWLFVRAAKAIVLVVAAADLLAFAMPLISTSPARSVYPPVPELQFLARNAPPDAVRVAGFGAALPPDSAMPYLLAMAEGYDSLNLESYARLFAVADGKRYVGNMLKLHRLDSPWLGVLNVGWLITPEREVPPPFVLHSGGPPFIYSNPSVWPRAFLAAPESAGADSAARLPTRMVGTAVIREYLPESIRVEAQTAGDVVLVLSHAFFPGWRASVDGKSAVIQRYAGALQAVPLSAGQHVVRLTYHPQAFALGSAVSLLALFACGFLVGCRRSPLLAA